MTRSRIRDVRPSGPPRPPAAERGSMSVFVVIFSVTVFLLAGLLVDGGAAMNARLKAADIAEQAARAAADQIDTERLRSTGEVRLQAGNAVCGRAEEIVAAHDVDGVRMTDCAPGDAGADVTVGVSVHWDALFLSVLGFSGSDMKAAATAAPDPGAAA
ncbi:pilus assembly protein TadG-related protein [Microbispora sp. NPDC049125]|uniref:pilus assembly protein TadG-related protein n=1 Tax=Microbispora sp. NPDC049125 TaxID=3154929 RepID=UPI0034671676